jgi:DNA-binding transcriptional MerR regulator
MDKPLPQITFDFVDSGNVQPEAVPPTPDNERKTTPVKNARGRKSLKDLETAADRVDVPEDELLFQKQYYGIGEVAAMFGVNISLIRYWENEFDILQPRKNRKGDRLFKPEDIKNLQLIHDLLRRRKFTIEGAKDFLKKNKKAQETHELILSLEKVRSFLLHLKANL